MKHLLTSTVSAFQTLAFAVLWILIPVAILAALWGAAIYPDLRKAWDGNHDYSECDE